VSNVAHAHTARQIRATSNTKNLRGAAADWCRGPVPSTATEVRIDVICTRYTKLTITAYPPLPARYILHPALVSRPMPPHSSIPSDSHPAHIPHSPFPIPPDSKTPTFTIYHFPINHFPSSSPRPAPPYVVNCLEYYTSAIPKTKNKTP
jgi:hypothetical protein